MPVWKPLKVFNDQSEEILVSMTILLRRQALYWRNPVGKFLLSSLANFI